LLALSASRTQLRGYSKGLQSRTGALRDFLNSTQNGVGHPGAMTRLDLTEREIDQISAYLKLLQQAK